MTNSSSHHLISTSSSAISPFRVLNRPVVCLNSGPITLFMILDFLTYYFSFPHSSEPCVVFTFIRYKHHHKLLSRGFNGFNGSNAFVIVNSAHSLSDQMVVFRVAVEEFHVIIKTLLVFLQSKLLQF